MTGGCSKAPALGWWRAISQRPEGSEGSLSAGAPSNTSGAEGMVRRKPETSGPGMRASRTGPKGHSGHVRDLRFCPKDSGV